MRPSSFSATERRSLRHYLRTSNEFFRPRCPESFEHERRAGFAMLSVSSGAVPLARCRFPLHEDVAVSSQHRCDGGDPVCVSPLGNGPVDGSGGRDIGSSEAWRLISRVWNVQKSGGDDGRKR